MDDMEHDKNEVALPYRYLDSEQDRQALVADIVQLRRAVMQLPTIIPETLWYEPRYHNWSLAAMLGHLQFCDTLSIIGIRSAMVGINFRIPANWWHAMNDFTAGRMFRKRVIATTLRGLDNNETRVANLIMETPMEKFTARVYDPPTASYLTLERALQKWFLFHWQEHLQTAREVEGISSEPSE